MSSNVPGRVPGSSKTYEKTIDAQSKTTDVTKTTHLPDGTIGDVKRSAVR